VGRAQDRPRGLSPSREIFVEFIIQGNVVKATAIDPVTGTEASVVGPANAAQAVMAQAARRKLEYVLKKKS
jgi:hypothetical protein